MVFSTGAGISGFPAAQVCGVPFVATVYSVDASGTVPFESNAFVSLSSNGIPSTLFSGNPVSLNQTHDSVITSKQYVTVTANCLATGNVGIYGNSAGLYPVSITITAQYISSFSFAALSDAEAGTPFNAVITAIDNTNTTVTGFNGTATLYARYPSAAEDVNLGMISFVNGVYTGNITLYNADGGNVHLQIVSTIPSRTNNSNDFRVSAAALDRLLVVAPNQVFAAGQSGNGRLGNSTYGITQTAGTPFRVTVYAVDAYFNTVTSATGSVTLDSSDENDSYASSTAALVSGMAAFDVTLRTVGAARYQTLTATHSSGASAGTDIIPMTFSPVHAMFYMPHNITNKNAGQIIATSCVAMDTYGNTITNYSGSPSLAVLVGGVSVASAYYSVAPISFTGGIGTFGVIVYQKAFNVSLRMTAGSVVNDSNSFTVNSGSFYKILQVAPGETYLPGYNVPADPNKGKSGSVSSMTAGTGLSVNVYATDRWGNIISANNDIVAVTSGDSGASVNGESLPQYVTLTAGAGSYNIILVHGATQSITTADTQTSVLSGTVVVPVSASALSYFDINIPSASVTAGITTTATISARDMYGNLKTDFAVYGNETLYVSSPGTDYSLPFETTMYLGGSNAGSSGYKWAVTFTASDNGQKTLNFAMYRAVTYTARLFASNISTDTPDVNYGNTGNSNALSINFGSAKKLQIIVPGVERRPGTTDGENGVPTGQLVGGAFNTEVNITDNWWNRISNAVYEVGLASTDLPNTIIDNMAPSPLVYKYTANGIANFSVKYNLTAASLPLISSSTYPGLVQDVSGGIQFQSVSTFRITDISGNPIGTQVAGVPFSISITAMSDPVNVATAFTGTQVELYDGNDYSAQGYTASEYLIEPVRSLTFTAGVCVMQVTMYKAATTVEGGAGGGTTVKAKFSSVTANSDKFNLYWGSPEKVMVLNKGMTHKPGLAHLHIPGYYGYTGNAEVHEAGVAKELTVLIVDHQYNRVYNAPLQTVQLQSSDSAASVTEGVLPVTVNMTSGSYQSLLALRTMGAWAYQTITADHAILADNLSAQIPVKHTVPSYFTVEAWSGSVLAGQNLRLTVTAKDSYGNICDNLNEGTPYNGFADLSAFSGGSNTIYPKNINLVNGRTVTDVKLFRAPIVETINASQGMLTTASPPSVIVMPNTFERLIVMTSGMSYDNGRYVSEPPVSFPAFYGIPVTRTVNDNPSHPATLFTFYSCDAYGNRTVTADTTGMTITVTTNDHHAKPVDPLFIPAGQNFVTTNIEFHTAMSGVTVGAGCQRSGISGFETPGFVTTAGDLHGIQLVLPGRYVDAGSGTATTSVDWDAGVRGQAYNQLQGSYFPISAYASDIYGNYKEGVADNIRIRSSDFSPLAYPNSGSNQITVTMIDGKVNTLAALATLGDREFTYSDISNPVFNRDYIYPELVKLVNAANLEFQIIVNGELNELGTESTTAAADPGSFDLTVSVVDASASIKVPVGGFSCAVDLQSVTSGVNSNIIVGGTLSQTYLNLVNGTYTGKISFDRSGLFRIRATDSAGQVNNGWSCIIDMQANTATAVMELSAQPMTLTGNGTSEIKAAVHDANGNSINSGSVKFTVVSGGALFSGVTQTTVAVTGGQALAELTGMNSDGQAVLLAEYGAISDMITLNTLRQPTPTRTATITPTVSDTATETCTYTVSMTATQTPTATETMTITLTCSVTPEITPTVTATVTTQIPQDPLAGEIMIRARTLLYPNPARKFFRIGVRDISDLTDVEISVYTISARLIKRNVFDVKQGNVYEIDAKKFGNGLYIITINGRKDGKQVFKDIKECIVIK